MPAAAASAMVTTAARVGRVAVEAVRVVAAVVLEAREATGLEAMGLAVVVEEDRAMAAVVMEAAQRSARWRRKHARYTADTASARCSTADPHREGCTSQKGSCRAQAPALYTERYPSRWAPPSAEGW